MRCLALVTIAIIGLVPQTAWAQARAAAGPQLSSGAGMFGASNLGGSFSPAQSNFRGSAATRPQGTVAGLTQQSNANVGQIAGNERFIRGNRQGGQFVGRDQTDSTAFVGATTGGLGQVGATAGLQRRNQQNPNNAARQGTTGRNQKQYRTIRTPAFDFPEPLPETVSATLGSRMVAAQIAPSSRQAVGLRSLAGVQVAVEGRTAILRGAVTRDHDRVLAEKLALLEPGISRVRNELTLPGPAVDTRPAEETLPVPASSN